MDGKIPVFSVMFGSEQIHAPKKIHQECTPISSASAWEDGRLELLVKTYPDGCVARFFGTLRTVQEAREAALQNYAPLEEQILS
jgi:NAD(P)H-flavin reductase